MKSRKSLMTAAMSVLIVGVATAQRDYKSFSFVEAQGGLQLTSTNAPMDKLFTPTAAFSLGHYFTPVVGARLHVNAWQSKAGFADLDKYYKWKYVTPDLDLMLNLSNLICKGTTNHALNLILLGGVGLNYAWDSDELKNLNLEASVAPLAWDDNRLSHNLRAGLRLETNQSKPLGFSFEANANSLSDRFNSKINDADDWQFTAMLGVVYRFNYKKDEPRYITKMVEVVDSVDAEEPITIMVKEKRPVEKMEKTKVEKVIFFEICQSDANKAQGTEAAIKETAELMKSSPDAVISVVGYADKGTGNARLNKMYAKRRADDVTARLVKDHGLDATRIKTDSKGDTVQPFAENDKNRCVIVTGEGTFKVTSYEEVEVEKQSTKKVKKAVTRQVEVKEQIN
ncbi:MAG: OmpA family protein [Prevotella sp.]|nr:OmpA family protein [Prevotella sp.]